MAVLGPPVIQLLDPHTVNQIAAGEVVERPASALKELVENSLDAGAASVTVDLEDAGRRAIQVADDGIGMDEDSARMALLRHATSKIRRAEDLLSVSSLGFRGEALPAMASVSRLILSTGQSDGARIRITVEDGAAGPAESEPGPRGTTIRIEDLFHNTPARLKFLKSDATEIGACLEAVSKAALSRPDVRFLVRLDGQTVLQTSGSGDLETALAEVWGRDVARGLAPIDHFAGACRVRGFVSPPHFTKASRSHQWLFVNGRPMRSRSLTAALDQASRSLTPERRYLVACLLLDIDPARIDVNVSPTKSEVKFHQEGQVFDAVRRAVRDSLLSHGMAPSAEDLALVDQALRRDPPSPSLTSLSLFAQAPLSLAEPSDPPISTRLPDLLEGLRVIGQVDRTFILAENDHAMLIIDQHVAHERILYEMLRDTRGAGAVEVQNLLAPETLHVERRAMEAVLPRLKEFAELGFDLEPFGSDSFLVRAVPALVRGRKPLAILRDLIDQIADGQMEGCAAPARDEVYILASCKMAVKAGDVLGLPEMERLVLDLARTENPYHCPHGRPITITFPKAELRRRFKR